METLKRQAIKQSLREGINANIENYPTQDVNGGCYPLDDSVSMLYNWIESEFDNDEEENKGSLSEWKEICIDAFMDVLELEESHNDEDNTILNRINKELEDLK